MATDLERLVVRLEAQMRTFDREMQRARGTANTQLGRIERRFAQSNKKLVASFGGLGSSLGRVLGGAAVVAIGQNLVDSSVRIENALKVAGLSGEELSRVYNELYASAQRNAAPLESLVQLYGRAALVQKELGASTEEMIRFTDNVAIALRVSGKSAQESSGALLQLSQALGSGVVRAEEFNSMLEGALPIVQAAAAGIEEAGGSVAKLRQLVVDGKVSSQAFFRGFEAGAQTLQSQVAGAEFTVAQGFVRLQNTMIDAAKRVNETTQASKTAASALELLTFAVTKLGEAFAGEEMKNYVNDLNALGAAARNLWRDPSFQNLYEVLFDTSGSVAKAGPADAIEAHAKALDELRGAMTRAAATAKTAAQGVGSDFINQAFGSFTPKKVSISDYAVSADSKGKTRKRDPFESALDSALKRVEVMRAETAAIDKNTAARERAKLVAELEVAAKAKNEAAGLKNIEVNEAQRQKINEVADAMYRVVEASEAAKNPLSEFAREAAKVNENLADATLSGLTSFENALVSIVDRSKDAKEAFRDMANAILSDIARLMIRQNITGPIASALGALFGGGGYSANPWSSGGMFGGPKAGGGPVQAGHVYKVGEHGTELFSPAVNGNIIPNRAIAPRGASGGDRRIAVEVFVRDDGTLGAIAREEGRRGGGEAADVRVRTFSDRELPSRMREINRNPRRIGR